jgi:hypothetical protein
VRKNYYQEVNEDALVMWAHEVDQPAYAELLDRIEAGIPGTTIVDAGRLRDERLRDERPR